MVKLTRILALIGYIAFASVPLNAAATYVIDFGTGLAGPGGTITDTGTTISGANIHIGSMIVQGTASSDGTYEVDALLNFDTNANTLSIFGNIASLGIVDDTLLSGSITTFNFTEYTGPTEVFDAA